MKTSKKRERGSLRVPLGEIGRKVWNDDRGSPKKGVRGKNFFGGGDHASKPKEIVETRTGRCSGFG